jgi:hypothetical protein
MVGSQGRARIRLARSPTWSETYPGPPVRNVAGQFPPERISQPGARHEPAEQGTAARSTLKSPHTTAGAETLHTARARVQPAGRGAAGRTGSPGGHATEAIARAWRAWPASACPSSRSWYAASPNCWARTPIRAPEAVRRMFGCERDAAEHLHRGGAMRPPSAAAGARAGEATVRSGKSKALS